MAEVNNEVRDSITCKKCTKTMLADNFYMARDKEKYTPDGRVDTCKKCLTMHVNNWEPSTFLFILEMIDVPYIEVEWNALLDRYGKDPKKTSPTAIVGRYLAKMKLRQYSTFRYVDTLRIREEEEKKKAMAKQLEDDQRNKYSESLQGGIIDGVDTDGMSDEEIAAMFPQPDVAPISFEDQITPEEKKMLSLKWGKLYQLEEWINMEKFFQEMMDAYDIQTPSHINYLQKICKTSLKMDQAIDCGDIEGFQKLSKVYDLLMKSAKFTAAQNKAESDAFIDSIGEMVALCEMEGFIPKYITDEPKDVVDITVRDINRYSERLIKNEMNLGSMIESALLKMKIEEEREEGELDENDEFVNPDMEAVLEDSAFEEYGEFVDGQVDEDSDMVEKEVE